MHHDLDAEASDSGPGPATPPPFAAPVTTAGTRTGVTRRELIKWAGAGAGAAAVAGGTWVLARDDGPRAAIPTYGPDEQGPAGSSNAPTATDGEAPIGSVGAAPNAPTSNVRATSDLAARLLVVVEMGGGNDGLSMIVPYGMGAYYDLRQSTGIGADRVLAIDDEVGYPDTMPGLHRRGAAIVQGVGSPVPDGSHFEMMARWWAGDTTRLGTYDTGFLGRLADAIGDPAAAAVAVSTGGGNHPALIARLAATMGISSLDAAGYLAGASDDDVLLRSFQRGLAAMASGDSDALVARLRAANRQAIGFAETIIEGDDHEGEDGYPDSDLGRSLALATRLFTADTGVRIVHVPMGGDFDTHEGHVDRHAELMRTFDEAVNAFLDDLAAQDLADRVLIMTTSEFGRRARDNGSSGLDHGTASNTLLLGPVNAGRYGEQPSLTSLDADDNFVATVGFDQYYATVAESWFGVPASDVLARDARPIDGIIAT